MPKVSIIISTYNRPKYLRQAIGSILAQTLEDWECLIVDDWSTTWEPNDSYGVKRLLNLPQFHWLYTDLPKHESDRSPGIDSEGRNRYCHNINLAFKHSMGEYITYLCDDDLYMPHRLRFMVQFLDNDPDVMLCYGKQQLLHEHPSGSTFLDKQDRWAGKGPVNGVVRIDHSSIMHRREIFEQVGGWDEAAPARLGDAHFFQRLHEAGHFFYGIQEVLDIHRFHEATTTKAEEKFLELAPTQ